MFAATKSINALVAGLIAGLLVLSGCGESAAEQSSAGNPPADLRLPLAVGLARDQEGLTDQALAVSTPSNPDYGKWLSSSQIAADFGAPQQRAQQVLETLQEAGFAGEIDATGGFIVGDMSVAQAEDFFKVTFLTVDEGPYAVVQPERVVRKPKSLGAEVTEIVGLTGAFPTGITLPSPTPLPSDFPCPPRQNLTQTLLPRYGLDTVVAQGQGGAGVQVAIMQVDQTSQAALVQYQRCYEHPIPPVTNVAVDATDPIVFGPLAEESTLDIVAAALVAPNLSGIYTYQYNPISSILFPLSQAAAAGYASDIPQVISTSIGYCETQLRPETIKLTEWVLASVAANGQTVVAASGDTGSSGCAPVSTEKAVQYPASSPFVTSIGGTQFVGNVSSGPEVVWNTSPGTSQASGGESTNNFPRPDYQQGLPFEGGRLIPDVAFAAAPAIFGAIPVCGIDGSCELKHVGGTSASSPGIAGAIANVMTALGAPGQPRKLGLINPLLYQTATSRSGSSVFHDITQGNNDLYAVGCCQAMPGFDLTTGWGSMDFAQWLEYVRQQLPPALPR